MTYTTNTILTNQTDYFQIILPIDTNGTVTNYTGKMLTKLEFKNAYVQAQNSVADGTITTSEFNTLIANLYDEFEGANVLDVAITNGIEIEIVGAIADQMRIAKTEKETSAVAKLGVIL